jgi:hypothetical protein
MAAEDILVHHSSLHQSCQLAVRERQAENHGENQHENKSEGLEFLITTSMMQSDDESTSECKQEWTLRGMHTE